MRNEWGRLLTRGGPNPKRREREAMQQRVGVFGPAARKMAETGEVVSGAIRVQRPDGEFAADRVGLSCPSCGVSCGVIESTPGDPASWSPNAVTTLRTGARLTFAVVEPDQVEEGPKRARRAPASKKRS